MRSNVLRAVASAPAELAELALVASAAVGHQTAQDVVAYGGDELASVAGSADVVVGAVGVAGVVGVVGAAGEAAGFGGGSKAVSDSGDSGASVSGGAAKGAQTQNVAAAGEAHFGSGGDSVSGGG